MDPGTRIQVNSTQSHVKAIPCIKKQPKKKSLRRPQEEKERKGPTINYKVINKYTSYINVVLLLSNNLKEQKKFKEQKFPRKKKSKEYKLHYLFQSYIVSKLYSGEKLGYKFGCS